MTSRYSFKRAFRIDPYGWHVYLFTDAEKWCRFVVRRKVCAGKVAREAATHADGVFLPGLRECYIGVFSGKAGTLAHEMTHAAVHILATDGVKVTKNNDEALAYLVGFMVDECANYLQ